MKLLNLACGPDIREGFDNLDARTGWRFQDGLRRYRDESVDGITIGCALYLIDPSEQRTFLAECYRVLKPGGVIRITEPDVTKNIWRGLVDAGLVTSRMGAGESFRKELPLANGREGREDVFTIEGLKCATST